MSHYVVKESYNLFLQTRATNPSNLGPVLNSRKGANHSSDQANGMHLSAYHSLDWVHASVVSLVPLEEYKSEGNEPGKMSANKDKNRRKDEWDRKKIISFTTTPPELKCIWGLLINMWWLNPQSHHWVTRQNKKCKVRERRRGRKEGGGRREKLCDRAGGGQGENKWQALVHLSGQ